MALATQGDVEARLGRTLDASEALRAPSLLDDASALVIGYCGQDFEPPPYPVAVVGVVARMVIRTLSQGAVAPGMESTTETAGPFTRGYKFGGGSSGDVFLSATDKMMLRGHRRGGGLSSIGLVGARYEITED